MPRWMMSLWIGAVLVLASAGVVAAQNGSELPLDEPVDAELADGQMHAYTFRIEGEAALTAEMAAAPAGTLDPILELYAPDGGLLAFNDDRARGVPDAALIDVGLSAPGVYTLVARSYGNRGSGGYVLDASLEELATLNASAPIAIGETIDAELFVEGQVDRWVFEGEAGQVVRIAMNAARGSRIDPLLELLGPDGTPLADNDDDGGDVNSLIAAVSLPEDGTYTIVARAWGNITTGPYALSLEAVDAAEITPTAASE